MEDFGGKSIVFCRVYCILKDRFRIQQCRAVNGVFVFAVQLHGGIIVSRRDEQCKAVETKQTFNSVLPFGIGDLEYVAKVDNFICPESKFCTQDTAQAGSVGRFGFITGFAVPCAEFTDFIIELFGFGFKLG